MKRAGPAIAILLVAVAGWLAWRAAPSLPAPRYVVLISLDTLRADHLGLYGYQRETSPLLDAFARDAFVFDHALAPAPNTPPSQASLMTSLYPGEHGFTGGGAGIAPEHAMLAELMRDAGLQTAGFVDGGYLAARFGFGRGFDVYEDTRGGFERIVPRAQQWAQLHRDAPFFLFLHTYDIHTPYLPPLPFRWMFHEKPFRGSFMPTVGNMNKAAYWGRKLSAEELRHTIALYDAGIRYTDAKLSEFLRFAERLGVLDEAAVIITSDHGEEFNEHGGYLHWRLFYQPNLRIPLVIRPPGGLARQVRIGARVEAVDVLPTLLDWLGQPPLETAQGRSLLPLMRGAASPWWGWLGAGAEERGAAIAWPPAPAKMPLRSVIRDRHQLVFDPEGDRMQLFDLERDPMALTDVAAAEPERVVQLRAAWNAWLEARGRKEPSASGAPAEIDEDTRRELQELGYLP